MSLCDTACIGVQESRAIQYGIRVQKRRGMHRSTILNSTLIMVQYWQRNAAGLYRAGNTVIHEYHNFTNESMAFSVGRLKPKTRGLECGKKCKPLWILVFSSGKEKGCERYMHFISLSSLKQQTGLVWRSLNRTRELSIADAMSWECEHQAATLKSNKYPVTFRQKTCWGWMPSSSEDG